MIIMIIITLGAKILWATIYIYSTCSESKHNILAFLVNEILLNLSMESWNSAFNAHSSREWVSDYSSENICNSKQERQRPIKKLLTFSHVAFSYPSTSRALSHIHTQKQNKTKQNKKKLQI
jgi:hypothetical protein